MLHCNALQRCKSEQRPGKQPETASTSNAARPPFSAEDRPGSRAPGAAAAPSSMLPNAVPAPDSAPLAEAASGAPPAAAARAAPAATSSGSSSAAPAPAPPGAAGRALLHSEMSFRRPSPRFHTRGTQRALAPSGLTTCARTPALSNLIKVGAMPGMRAPLAPSIVRAAHHPSRLHSTEQGAAMPAPGPAARDAAQRRACARARHPLPPSTDIAIRITLESSPKST